MPFGQVLLTQINARKSFLNIVFTVLLLLVLIPSYYYRVGYSLWYDEAGVVENVINGNFSELKAGMNWLQTIPLGYYCIAKLLLLSEYGVELLRLSSLLAFLLSLSLILKHLMVKVDDWSKRWIFTFIFLCNPISITYATMVKPYAIELLLGIAAVVSFSRQDYRRLFLIATVGSLFSNSIVLILLSISILIFLQRKRQKEAVQILLASSISTGLSLYFTSTGTRNLMRDAWFGSVEGVGLSSLKSAVGGLGWLPVSGLGLMPNGLFGVHAHYVSLAVMVCILLIIYLRRSLSLARAELSLVFLVALSLFFLAHSLLLLPATGRLMLSISTLAWILLLNQIQDWHKIVKLTTYAILLVATIGSSQTSQLFFRTSGDSHVREILESHTGAVGAGVYTNVWAGPATQIYLNSSGVQISPNVIWVDEGVFPTACRAETLLPGSVIVVDFVQEDTFARFRENTSLELLDISGVSGIFRVLESLHVEKTRKYLGAISCRYDWSNPRNPVGENS